MRRLGLPQVLGFIIAGLLLGPAIWGLFFDLSGSEIFPITYDNNKYLKAFSEVGVIFVMFTAGLETNIKDIKDTGFVALLVALGGVLLPLGAGTLLGFLFLREEPWTTWLFIGVIMTATSVGITVEVLRELKKLQTKVGTIVMSAAIIDDVLGIIVLSIALSIAGGKETSSPVIQAVNPNNSPIISIFWIFAFFVFAIGVGYFISKLFKFIEKKNPHTRRIPIFSIGACMLYAFIAEYIFGVADITGAFICGVILSTNHASAEYVDRRVTISSYLLFAPIFFACIGIKIDFTSFNLNVILFAISFVIIAILMKIIGCGGTAKLFGLSNKDSLRVGFGMIARGEVALIVTQKGMAGGLLDEKYIAITVLLVLVSSILAPIILKLLYKGDDKVIPTHQELEEGHFE
ncbi:MAG: cation:proton antiporter [Firmicutes bacterium]|nr:cation:proton antiporter [Candidatus Caballimonas caccae]